MITVLCVVGTRPEAIKMAPVLRALARHPGRIRSSLCSTGQHSHLLDQAFDLFGLVPDHALGLMEPGQGLSGLASALLRGLDRVVAEVRPDWVLAQGDTSTVFAASLVAYYRGVRFGHVEAGLRTGDRRQPFPEEVHRRVADLVADAHFAPTEHAARALHAEGCPLSSVVVTGNTVIDALHEIANRPHDWSTGPLSALPRDRRLVLVTAHRRENFGEPLRRICAALSELPANLEAEGVHFVFPVHPNPEVSRPVRALLGGTPGLSLLEPIDYLSLAHLLKNSELVLTDSGGLQEEAPALGIPVLVLRETTERPEGLEAGAARLVGTDPARIVAEVTRLIRDASARAAMVPACNPYGDGRAADRIVAHLLDREQRTPARP